MFAFNKIVVVSIMLIIINNYKYPKSPSIGCWLNTFYFHILGFFPDIKNKNKNEEILFV
jgi:hypothetical protein